MLYFARTCYSSVLANCENVSHEFGWKSHGDIMDRMMELSLEMEIQSTDELCKKSLQKKTHSHRHHAIISKVSCHHIPGIPLTFHQNIPFFYPSLPSLVTPLLWGPTVVHANNLPCLGHLSAASDNEVKCCTVLWYPEKCHAPPKRKKKSMWGSYYWHPKIHIIHIYI